MVRFDERFFTLRECRYNKEKGTAVITFLGHDNFEPEIPKNESSITRQINDLLDGEKLDVDFEYFTIPPEYLENQFGNPEESLKHLNAYAEQVAAQNAALPDKILPMKSREYLCGVPIKTRPIKIKYLRASSDLQVTGGTISFFKKKEYKRQHEGAEIIKPYFTFVLDDGDDRINCVFFPTAKTFQKFEKLGDRSAICAIGVAEKRDDRLNFRVAGVSFVEF